MGILERLDEIGKMLYPDVNYERVSKCIKLSKKMYNERKDNKIRFIEKNRVTTYQDFSDSIFQRHFKRVQTSTREVPTHVQKIALNFHLTLVASASPSVGLSTTRTSGSTFHPSSLSGEESCLVAPRLPPTPASAPGDGSGENPAKAASLGASVLKKASLLACLHNKQKYLR